MQLMMATTATPGIYLATTRPCIGKTFKPSGSVFNMELKNAYGNSRQLISKSFTTWPRKLEKLVTRATLSEAKKNNTGLTIDLRGKKAFVAGVADDHGYGWAIAKSLAAAGADIIIGTWVPAKNIFEHNLRHGKLDESRILPDGSLMDIAKIYPLDAVYDTPDDVPEHIKTNKRYAGHSNWTIQLGMKNSRQYLSFLLEKPSIEYVTTDLSWQEVAEAVKQDFGSIDILVHSLANGPEVKKPLLETSRNGYLAAISASTYSYLSLLQHFIPIMNPGGSSLSLTYIAANRMINSYGGGMSSAKAALESDTRVLAFEAGRKHKIRINAISAGPLASRAAKAIGELEEMINYSFANSPLKKKLNAGEVGNVAAFLASPLASAVTGAVVYVDNGLNVMGTAIDSRSCTSLKFD